MDQKTKRLNLEIPEELHTRIRKFVPKGMTNRVGISLFEMVADACEKHGRKVIGAVVTHGWNPCDKAVKQMEADSGQNTGGYNHGDGSDVGGGTQRTPE